jgi:hypothetical protein
MMLQVTVSMLALERTTIFPKKNILSSLPCLLKWIDCNNRWLNKKYGDKQKAWSYTMVIVGLIMAALTIYNYFYAKN